MNATDSQGILDAYTEGSTKIGVEKMRDIMQDFNDRKAAAKLEAENKGLTAKNAIDAREDLSEADKEAAKRAIDEMVKKAQDAIDAAESFGDVDSALENCSGEVSSYTAEKSPGDMGVVTVILAAELIAIVAFMVLVLRKKKKK